MPVFDERQDINMVKPKKPLSAYNMFFRFERSRLLKASEINVIRFEKNQDGIIRIECKEQGKDNVYPDVSTFNIDVICDLINKEALMKKNGKRKRSHGKIGFTDMIKYMCKSWNEISPQTRQTFSQLASEEKEKYLKQLKAYNKARYDSVNDHVSDKCISLESNGIVSHKLCSHLYQAINKSEKSEAPRVFFQERQQEKTRESVMAKVYHS